MHRCLLVPELVYLICEEASNPGPSWNHNLVSLALTCKLFQEPSLDRLWYELGSIDPLIRCMPSDLWTIREGALTKWLCSVTFRRPITPDDWPRFVVNARRVRHLRGVFDGYHRHASMIQETYQHLELSNHPKPLLPNLKSITWVEYDDKIFPFVKLFLGPQLQRLSIDLGPTPFAKISLFNALCIQCPSITSLDISPMYPKAAVALDWAEAVSTALRSLTHLRHLTVEEIDLETFIHLAKLPHLQYLHCAINTITFPASFIPPSLPIFPSLQELFINITLEPLTVSLINCLSCRALKHIRIFLNRSPPSWTNDFIKILAGNCSRNILEGVLIIDVSSPDEETRYPPPVDISPLFAYSELTDLQIWNSDVDDKTMLTLAQSWPKITKLHLISASDGLQRTLRSVIHLAKYCKKLKSLYISVDARQVPMTYTLSESLISLMFTNSSISNSKRVANFVMTVFPNLDSFGSFNEENEVLWNEVDNLLLSFIDSRKAWLAKSDSEDSDSGSGFENSDPDLDSEDGSSDWY